MVENIFNIQRFEDAEAPIDNASGENKLSDAGKADGDKGSDKKSFEELIHTDYRDEYARRVEEIVKKRLRDHAETKEKLKTATSVLEDIRTNLGVDSSDPHEIISALKSRLSTSENVDAQGADPITEEDVSDGGKTLQLRQAVAKLAEAAEMTKGYYPGFDIARELRDSEYRSLLRMTANDPKRAYEMKYHDDIVASAIRHAARLTEERMANSIASKAARPAEGAGEGNSAVMINSDPKSLSKAQRADIKRRVRKGERIVW